MSNTVRVRVRVSMVGGTVGSWDTPCRPIGRLQCSAASSDWPMEGWEPMRSQEVSLQTGCRCIRKSRMSSSNSVTNHTEKNTCLFCCVVQEEVCVLKE